MRCNTCMIVLLIAGLVGPSATFAQRGQGRGAEQQQQHGPGQGRGFRGGRGIGGGPGFGGGRGFQAEGGHGHDERHDEDREVFQFLLTNHKKITRKVTELPNGVDTLTESSDPEIAAKIKEHVEWMKYRVENTNPIRMRDPLYAELFKHTDKIVMKHEDTENGVRVIETSEDPYVAKLIQKHAEVVSGFVERGFAEAMKNHPVPGADKKTVLKKLNPVIEKYGSIVRLPGAAQPPRAGSRFVADVTAGGKPGEVYPSLAKVARFVNLYSGEQSKSVDAQIAVVLHGDATSAALNADAYAEKFGTEDNPNFDVLHELHEAGVAIYVCGQSLIGQGNTPEETVVFADVAVSAVTSLVNLQADGYSYVPLK